MLEANVAQFNKELAAFTDKMVPEQANLFKRRVGLELLRRVVLKSPVDTGRFRGNWHVSLAQPTTAEQADAAGANPGAVVSEGNAVIAGVQPGQSIFVNNNVPYGPKIENGSSDQAPAGVVAVSMAEVSQLFKD